MRPKFFGVRVQDGEEYLAMENCTKGFARPCVLDMKMGFQTWHAECSEEKKRKHLLQDARFVRPFARLRSAAIRLVAATIIAAAHSLFAGSPLAEFLVRTLSSASTSWRRQSYASHEHNCMSHAGQRKL